MKNFKKVLALVLVLASLLGLATMAGAATEYKDADKINADYTEAIKVLDLIETMQGYPNGEFRPTANITREEAARIQFLPARCASDRSREAAPLPQAAPARAFAASEQSGCVCRLNGYMLDS